MKIGDLVEFTYGRVGGQIEGMGIFMEYGNDGKHKVLFMGKGYWVPEQLIKPISIARKDPANEPLDN
jgi:hypothetical protein|tara:strand:- start:1088 stop:1288 length:201 start_codon:yes stop_codon:yes gene_type:complete